MNYSLVLFVQTKFPSVFREVVREQLYDRRAGLTDKFDVIWVFTVQILESCVRDQGPRNLHLGSRLVCMGTLDLFSELEKHGDITPRIDSHWSLKTVI